MHKRISTSRPFHEDKDSRSSNQLQTIFQYLQEHTATASMVANATGVPQKNICRYKRDLEKVEKIWEIEKKMCLLTGFKAWYLTTNPEKAPNSNNQPKLF